MFCLLLSAYSVSAKKRRPNRQKPLELRDFSTDGCSAYPDGYVHTEEYEWLHCCFAHDIAYWVGGTEDKKAAADAELNRCVSEATFGTHGTVMELGVATGGTPYLATSWRWGYGWNRLVAYNALSHEKIKMIDKKAFTILDALVMESFYLNDEQVEYIKDSYSLFRDEILERMREEKAQE